MVLENTHKQFVPFVSGHKRIYREIETRSVQGLDRGARNRMPNKKRTSVRARDVGEIRVPYQFLLESIWSSPLVHKHAPKKQDEMAHALQKLARNPNPTIH